MFYVFANKLGTVRLASGDLCVEGNYKPAWSQEKCRYAVKGQWPENLWKAYKLDDDQYEQYLHLCKDGVVARKRNLDAVREWDEEQEEDAERVATTKRVRSKYEKFAPVAEVDSWLTD